MRPILTITLIVILALAMDNGDAWGRRRRRRSGRRRRRSWLKKLSKKVLTKAAIKYATGFLVGRKDVHSQLSTLKYNDRESYDNFMQLLKTDIENRFPLEEVDGIMENIDETADMQPGVNTHSSQECMKWYELLLLDGETEDNDYEELAGSETLRDLADRVDALNSH